MSLDGLLPKHPTVVFDNDFVGNLSVELVRYAHALNEFVDDAVHDREELAKRKLITLGSKFVEQVTRPPLAGLLRVVDRATQGALIADPVIVAVPSPGFLRKM